MYHEDGRECGKTEAGVTRPGGAVQTLTSDRAEGGRGSPDNALSTAASYKEEAASASPECLNQMGR